MAVEVITGIERRRRWRVDEKLPIVAEVEQSGACFAEVARRHEVSRGLLWNWRWQVRNGALRPTTGVQFPPVQVVSEATAADTSRPVKPCSFGNFRRHAGHSTRLLATGRVPHRGAVRST